MYLSVHATVGAIVGAQTGNPAIALGAGFASHLLLDIVPHGDSKKSGMSQTLKTIFVAAAIDVFVLSCIAVLILWRKGLLFFGPGVIVGAVGGILPDALQLPYLLSKGKYFEGYQRFHNFFHGAITDIWDLPCPIGILMQGLLLAGLIYLAA